MPANLTTLNARTADPVVKALSFIDQSGVGSGPYVPVHSDIQSQPFGGAVPMVIGTAQAPQRSVDVECTVAGNAVFEFPDGSTITKSLGVGGQTFPYACTKIVSATATAVFNNLI